MPIATKDLSAVAAKWAARAQAAGADYAAGVKSTTKDWAAHTAAASHTWAAGVQEAVGNKRFERGVERAGNAKWQANAAGKGAARYPQGVAGGTSAFASGFGPFLQTIQGLNLPPRSPRGSPANVQRVSAIMDALHAKKMSG